MRMRRAAFAAFVIAALAPTAARPDAAGERFPVAATPLVAPQPGTFVALWVGYGDERTRLERFSTLDGRTLGLAASLPQFPAYSAGPYRARDGSLWLTITSGPAAVNPGATETPLKPATSVGEAVRGDPV